MHAMGVSSLREGRRVAGGVGKDGGEAGGVSVAGGVFEGTGREPDDRAAGNGSRGWCGGVRLFGSVPCPVSSGAGSAAGCSHPFACPRPGPGRMGRVRVGRGGPGGANQGAPPPPGGGGGAGQKGAPRPAPCPGKPFPSPPPPPPPPSPPR